MPRTKTTRAASGEGGVYEAIIRNRRTGEPKKVFVAELQYVDLSTGLTHRGRIQRGTRSAALEALRRMRLDVATKKTVAKARADGRGPTVEASATSWLERRRPEIAANTFRQYEGNVRLHLAPRLGNIYVRRLTQADVSAFLGDETVGARTRQQCLGTLRQILADAVEDGTIEAMPIRTQGRRRAKVLVERREMHVLDANQQRAFLEAAIGHRLETLWIVALATGMREGEILGLRWSNVHESHIAVGRRLDSRTRAISPTKTKSGVRRIDVDAKTIAVLAAHRRRMLAERVAFDAFKMGQPTSRRAGPANPLPPLPSGSLCRPSDLVFVNTVGKPVSATNLTKRDFKALLAAAGLPNIRFHDLRHSHATLLLERGVNAKVVQERLGHESVKTTLDLYAHVLPASQRHAADETAEALWGSARSNPRSMESSERKKTKKP